MKVGFWKLLEELGPAPDLVDSWTTSVGTIQAYLSARDVELRAEMIESVLDAYEKQNVGTAWKVERIGEGRYKFTHT